MPPETLTVKEPSFPLLVRQELQRAREKHAIPIHSAHEGFAVILEEVDELKAEVFLQKRDDTRVLEELIQVGAMCQRMAEDVLIRKREG